MKNVRLKIKLLALVAGAVGFFLAGSPFGSRAQDQAALQPTRPGLNLEITSVTIPADRKPVVTFRITDSARLPLDRSGVLTVGPVTSSFVIARIEPNGTQYTSYITRTATGAVSGTVQQPTADSGGRYAELGDGRYTYTFGAALPESYNPNITHTVGIYASRNMAEFDGEVYVANAVRHFVPAGGEVTTVREVVKTEACNQCHNVLALHGGRRRETALCVLCHQPQNVDPDTGNTVDFKVMVHKYHRGEELENEYTAYSGRGSFTANETHFPGDLKDCGKCHLLQTNLLPMPSSVLPTVMPRGSFRGLPDPTMPVTAACTACHDSLSTAAHAATMTANGTREACVTCHGEGKDFAVSKMHAKVPGAVQ